MEGGTFPEALLERVSDASIGVEVPPGASGESCTVLTAPQKTQQDYVM